VGYPIIQQGLRNATLDFAVGPLPPQPIGEDFIIEEMFQNHRCVVGRHNHPLSGARTLSELTAADWVITGAIGPRGEEFQEIFTRNGLVVPRSLIRCESLISLLAVLAGSDALAFLPRQWVESSLTTPILAKINIAETVPGPPTCLVRRNGLPLTPAAEALATAFRREVAYYTNGQLASSKYKA
jgi:LysR family transcriptional regulator, regulator of abg operon